MENSSHAIAVKDEDSEQDCPYCSEKILLTAKKCKHCGEFLDQALRAENAPDQWRPGIAAALSIIPGAGQLYKGQILNGIMWFIMVSIGYFMLFFPGAFLHVCCICGAATGDPKKQSTTGSLALIFLGIVFLFGIGSFFESCGTRMAKYKSKTEQVQIKK